MTGHEPLLQMRRKGFAVPAVFVSTEPHAFRLEADWHLPGGSRFAHVRIDPHDIPEALDLRFAVGLEVHVDCWAHPHRAERLHAAFAAASPRLLATSTATETLVFHG